MKHTFELKPGERIDLPGGVVVEALSGTFHKEGKHPTVPCLLLEIEVPEAEAGSNHPKSEIRKS